MPETPSAESTAPYYDAFLSYSRADGAAVRRIQRFLESYRPPGRSTRLKVYLDETDMRGGSLPDNLSVALGQSRALVVCWSDNAARSQWVNAEIAEFRKLGRPSDIAVAHVAGDGPTVRHEAFAGLAPIEHDLRHGWFGWFLKPKARIELLRLIAFLTGVEMRVLHNWARRRVLRNAVVSFAVALLPVAGVLSVAQPHWEPAALTYKEATIRPVACAVIDGKLWAAAWSEAAGECSGVCAYSIAYPDVLTQSIKPIERPRTFKLVKRALPKPFVDPDVVQWTRRVLDANGLTSEMTRERQGDVDRIAAPRQDRFVLIRPLAIYQSNAATTPQIRDRLYELETNGALVVTYQDGSTPTLEKVADMSPPLWEEWTPDDERSSPAREISVVWQGSDDIWIGIAGERKAPGGLWHSEDRGRSWKKSDEFFSVTSLELVGVADKETLLVAEQSFKHLNGEENVPGASRVVAHAGGDRWVPASAPPYGSNSEIEFCGTLPDGTFNVRVDGTIYQKSSRSLLRLVLDGSGP